MLLLPPLASAVDLQPCGIDQNMDGPFLRDAIIVPPFRYSRLIGPTVQCRIIRNGEIQPNQLQHGGQETFRLTQPQAEHQALHQGSLNREIEVARLSTVRRPLWCLA